MRAVNSYIKFVRFEEIDRTNEAKRNPRLKNEFYLHLNARKYRGMKNFYAGDEKNFYCHFELVENILVVRANKDLIELCRKILSLFENVSEKISDTTAVAKDNINEKIPRSF